MSVADLYVVYVHGLGPVPESLLTWILCSLSSFYYGLVLNMKEVY